MRHKMTKQIELCLSTILGTSFMWILDVRGIMGVRGWRETGIGVPDGVVNGDGVWEMVVRFRFYCEKDHGLKFF